MKSLKTNNQSSVFSKVFNALFDSKYWVPVTYIFLVSQPIIDSLNRLFHFEHLSVSLMVRMIFMVYVLSILVFVKTPDKSQTVTYVILVIMFFQILVFSPNKSFSVIYANFKETLKSYYFIITFVWLLRLTKSKHFYIKSNDYLASYTLILLIFAISIFTNTSLRSYTWFNGISGWFYSANEISAILALFIPLIFVQIFKARQITFKFMLAGSVVIISMIIGTKTVFYSAMITYLVFCVYWLIQAMNKNARKPTIHLIILLFSIVLTALLYPYSPISNNNVILSDGVRTTLTVHETQIEKTKTLAIEKFTPASSLSNVSFTDKLNGILKNRIDYVLAIDDIFQSAPMESKLLGLGSYVVTDSTFKELQTEMDFFTIYYRYGMIGLLLFLTPFVLAISSLKKRFVLNLISSYELVGESLALVIVLGLAFFVGHVVISPAVSQYLSAALILFIQRNQPQQQINGKIVFISSAGGHLAQLLKLNPLFSKHESLVVTEDIPLNRTLSNQYNCSFLLTGNRTQKGYLWIFIKNTFKSFWIFTSFAPDIIITTGTHTAVPLALIAKLFGKRLIYIESFAKVKSGNLAGRILYPFADQFVVQWESLLPIYKKAEYWGSIY